MDPHIVLEPLTHGVAFEALRLPGSSRQALNALAARRPAPVVAIFHGPGRTGKAMVADALATHLGLAAWRVDLGRVVSRVEGETEARLAAVFDDARAAGVLLFFDDADALLGPRTGVRDALDRHASREIAYLLQRLDAWTGVAVFATTALQEVAPAMRRRCDASIGIPRTPGPR